MPFPFKLMKSRSQQYNVANKDLFVIPIELMTNECIECTLLTNSYGQECLSNVCQKIGLHQSDYFGLLFKSKKNVDQWVDLSKPLKKQLDKHATEVRLYFRLQYFVSNFQFLTDEVARNHYYFAMKMLVIEGKIACSRDDAIHLASFSLQAEFGDYSPERHTVEYLNNFALFPKAMLSTKVDKNILIECAIAAYKTLAGVVPSNVAEIYYISEAQAREGYGQEGFPARDLETGQDVCLGVCIRGIFVINTNSNTVELFKWLDIANLIHNKKIFTIERNADSYRKNYSTYDADYASCIWRTCVEQHQYFMKSVPNNAAAVNRVSAFLAEDVAAGHESLAGSNDYAHILIANEANNLAQNFMPNSEFYSLATATGNEPQGVNGSATFLAANGEQQQQQQQQMTIDYGRMQRLYDSLSQQHKQQQQQQQLQPTSVSHQLSRLNLNGNYDASLHQQQQHEARNRSSTEPLDLNHIRLNCDTPAGANFEQKCVVNTSSAPLENPPLPPPNPPPPATSNSNTPIYENQFDINEEQRRKMLPPYRPPPDYESFLKQKYSAMASLSQSLSSIPSRLMASNGRVGGSHGHINSAASSSSSLVQANFGNLASGARNAMSSLSVPLLLQQYQHPHHAMAHLPGTQQIGPLVPPATIYKNYSDLSNLKDDSFGGTRPLAGTKAPPLPPPNDRLMTLDEGPALINQLSFQKASMQQSGMFTSSSPELNTLQLLQQQQQQQHQHQQHQQQQQFHNLQQNNHKKSVQFRTGQIVGSVKNYPSFFASVPDLTFKSSIYSVNQSHSPDIIGGPLVNNGDYKKQAKNRFFGGRNMKIFQRHTAGSEPNLSNSLGGCYNLHSKALASSASGEHLTREQRSNSMSGESGVAGFNGHLHRHLYSIPNKIDELPELSGEVERRRSSADNVRVGGDGKVSDCVSVETNPSRALMGLVATTTIASNNSDVTTVRPQPSHIIYVNVNPNDSTTVSTRPELVRINKPLPPNPKSTTNISINSTMPATDDHDHEMLKSNGIAKSNVLANKSEGDADRSTQEMVATPKVLKSSRIIVFGQSFEDQDFTREFELLPRMNPEAKFTTASLPENVTRNRFRDILPYEENRVKLMASKDNKHGYINASHVYMTFGSMRQHYIAAQGPLPSTTIDFWQMVYEQCIGLIVMVTNFTESGHQKCHTYLPLSNEPGKNTIRFGDFEIRCNFTSMSNTFITSHLTLMYAGHKPRTVTHLRYTDWTDHSSPTDLQGFLSFLIEMDTIYRAHVRQLAGGGSGTGFGKAKSKAKLKSSSAELLNQQQPPILVHCSAGAGRSGVVILCHALLRCLDVNFNDPIDIPKALIELRYQRMISVQHCVQFRFVCQVLAQYLANSRLI